MKKLLLLIVIVLSFILTGCGKYDDKDVVKDLNKKIENNKGYYIEGEMNITNNEDVYKYNVKASYQSPDYFRVSLKNKANNHEQIILRNKEGVYVLTPALNKSFKFQSEWPFNNSQIYLFHALLKDLKDDKGKTFEETDNYYVFTTKVNYPNNRHLKKQVIYLDKKLTFKEVHVLDENNTPEIKMKFTKIDMKATFNKKYFDVNENMTASVIDEDVKTVSEIDDIIYPMYIPTNTHLTTQDTVDKTNGERIILTFAGDNPFVLVEETANPESEFTIIPTYGDPVLLNDTIGYVSDGAISWESDGMEYYVASDILSQDELVNVARSIGTLPVSTK